MLFDLIYALASLPMGDDTPILLFAIVGGVALLLLILSVVLGMKTRKK